MRDDLVDRFADAHDPEACVAFDLVAEELRQRFGFESILAYAQLPTDEELQQQEHGKTAAWRWIKHARPSVETLHCAVKVDLRRLVAALDGRCDHALAVLMDISYCGASDFEDRFREIVPGIDDPITDCFVTGFWIALFHLAE